MEDQFQLLMQLIAAERESAFEEADRVFRERLRAIEILRDLSQRIKLEPKTLRRGEVVDRVKAAVWKMGQTFSLKELCAVVGDDIESKSVSGALRRMGEVQVLEKGRGKRGSTYAKKEQVVEVQQ